MAPTGKVEGQNTTEIGKLYRDIDLLDGQEDQAYLSCVSLYRNAIFDACSKVEPTSTDAAATTRGRFLTRVKLTDRRTVNVSCADHIGHLRPVVEAIKKITWYANAALISQMDTTKPVTLDSRREAVARMSDQDRQLFHTANILDEVLVAYIEGKEDSTTPTAQAVENDVNRVIANRSDAQPVPESWLTEGRLDRAKVFRGMMDVLSTLGVDHIGLTPDAYRVGYRPKRLESIARPRQLLLPVAPR